MSKENLERLQARLFGRRYAGASLAKVQLGNDKDAIAVNAWIKNPKDFLILSGPAGTGKTYLCASLIEFIPLHIQTMRMYNEKELLRRVRQSISDNSKGDYITFLQYLIDDDLLILDDFGSAGHTDWREEVLLELIDYRYSRKLPTILSTNLSIEDIYKLYGQRIGSRLGAKENTIVNYNGYKDLRQEGL